MEDMLNFYNLSKCEATLAAKPSLKKLLLKSIEEAFDTRNCAELQRRFLIATVAQAYHHFGFCVFGPLGRAFVGEYLSRTAGLESQNVDFWLETLCYQILEDFNVLKIALGEPDWEQVDAAFARDFCKRLVCAEPEELFEAGLSAFNPADILAMHEIAMKFLRDRTGNGVAAHSAIPVQLRNTKFGPDVKEQLVICLKELDENPLRLLVWRLECFASFSELSDEARFFVRKDNETTETLAGRYVALLALLLPHQSADGKDLLPSSPLACSQLVRLLRGGSENVNFDCTVLRNWLAVPDKALPATCAQLLQSALAAKLVFEVPLRKTVSGFGLTRTAQRILAPFHATITQAISKTDEASGEPGPEQLPISA